MQPHLCLGIKIDPERSRLCVLLGQLLEGHVVCAARNNRSSDRVQAERACGLDVTSVSHLRLSIERDGCCQCKLAHETKVDMQIRKLHTTIAERCQAQQAAVRAAPGKLLIDPRIGNQVDVGFK